MATKFGTIDLREDPLNQIWYKCIHWGLVEKLVKYITFLCFFIYLYLHSETRVQVRPVHGFLRAIAQKT